MDWKLLLTSFVSIFAAEIGDKTQLATLSLAAGSGSRWTVFIASCLALIATSALAVVGGEALSRIVSPLTLKRFAGGLFIVLGVIYLVKAE